MPKVDIYILPVTNAGIKVLTLYDSIVRQWNPEITLTITDNASIDLSPQSIVSDDNIFYIRSDTKIKNTASLVTQAILKHPYPSPYLLLLNINSRITENTIFSLLNIIKTFPEDSIILGAVGHMIGRSTKRYPDPREKPYKDFLKTLRPSTSTVASDSRPFIKSSGNSTSEKIPESEKVLKKQKYFDFGIDLNVGGGRKTVKIPYGDLILEEPSEEALKWAREELKKVEGKKLDAKYVSELENARLVEPSNTNLDLRLQKFFSKTSWFEKFTSTNLLIRRDKLMEVGIFDENLPITDAILKFIVHSIEFLGNSIDFSPNWSVYEHYSKKFVRPSVEGKVNKIRKEFPVPSDTKNLDEFHSVGKTTSGPERVRENLIPSPYPQSLLEFQAPFPYSRPIFFYRNYKEGNLVAFNSEGRLSTRLSIVYRHVSPILREYNSTQIWRGEKFSMERLRHKLEMCDGEFYLYLNEDEKDIGQSDIDGWLRFTLENCEDVTVKEGGYYRVLHDRMEIGEDWSFCCHRSKLDGWRGCLKEWGMSIARRGERVRDVVSEYIGRYALISGDARGKLGEANFPSRPHKTSWYDWMED